MAQMRQFNRFMNQFIPMLVQQKLEKDRAQTWLEKTLAEYEAWAGNQRDAAKQSLMNSIIELIAKGGYEQFQARPLGEEGYIEFLQRTLPPDVMPRVTMPTDYQDRLEQTLGAIVEATMAAQGGGTVSPDVVSVLARTIGQKYPTEIIQGIVREKGETAGRAIRGRELTIEERKLPILQEQTRLRGKELEIEGKGGKTNKALRDDFDALQKERQSLLHKLVGVGQEIPNINTETTNAVLASIMKVNEQMAVIAEEMGAPNPLPGPQDYETMRAFILEQIQEKKHINAINWYKLILDGFTPDWVMSTMDDMELMLAGKKPREPELSKSAEARLRETQEELRRRSGKK